MAASIRFLDNDGVTAITLETLADALAGVNQTPRKFGFHSTSDRPLGVSPAALLVGLGIVAGNDGIDESRTINDSAAAAPTIGPPWGFTATVTAPGAGGVWGATGTYGYRITSLTALGESGPQDEITAVVDDTTEKVNLAWTQVPGATGYKIYRTPTPGTYGASTLLTTIGSGATVSFSDDGSATSTGTLPLANTTGGWGLGASLGSPGAGGTWALTGVYYWSVVGLDATGVILSQTVEASVNVDDTTKKVTLTWVNNPNAATYSVYRSTTPGDYSSPALVVSGLAAGTTTYLDGGAATAAGGLSTGPSYGIPPAVGSFGTGDITIGNSIQPGQEFYVWFNRVVPLGTPEAGNPRQVLLNVKEA